MPDPIPLIVQGDENVTLSPEELRVINAVSPEAQVKENEDGAEITIKDLKHGETKAQIYNGRQGIQGEDGFSPVITSEAITGGHRITIVDAFHPQGIVIDVMNGVDGKGIVSIEKTSTSGFEDTYTITYTTGAPTTFTVTNGRDGSPGRDGTDGTNGRDGTDGTDGTTFTPAVSSEGVISWTNDGNKQNPSPVNIKGPAGTDGQNGQNGTDGVSPVVTITNITGGHQVSITDADHPGGQTFDVMDGADGQNGTPGRDGIDGTNGTDGANGVTFTPSVSSAGIISWTNDGNLPNPQSVDIKGPQGESGAVVTVSISGTTPSITAEDNHRYVCGEVATITITPPVSGICAVRFTSGSTAAVLTCSAQFPDDFDATALETNTIYEINILDGLALVAKWAVSA